MKKLWLYETSLKNEAIAVIASCVDKIEELVFNAGGITMHGWKILSTAINNRPTPVSRRNLNFIVR